jgi:hypothetical protein
VRGLGESVVEAMANKQYNEAAEGLTQMDRLTCIDNIVVDRLLEGVKHEVNKAASIPSCRPPRVLSRHYCRSTCTSHAPRIHHARKFTTNA